MQFMNLEELEIKSEIKKIKKEKNPLYSFVDNDFSISEKEQMFLDKTGDKFTNFYKKYLPKLNYFVNNICHDKETAEDISIDAFMISLNKIEDFDPNTAKFSTWIFTIAKNLTYHTLNKNKKTISMDNQMDDDSDEGSTTLKDFLSIPEEETTEDHLIAIDEKAELMKRSMNKLDKTHKRVIKMREIEGMSYQEIADKLKRNLNTVKSQIRNSRIELVNITEKEFKKIDNRFK